jgi:hypothetical protein
MLRLGSVVQRMHDAGHDGGTSVRGSVVVGTDLIPERIMQIDFLGEPLHESSEPADHGPVVVAPSLLQLEDVPNSLFEVRAQPATRVSRDSPRQ